MDVSEPESTAELTFQLSMAIVACGKKLVLVKETLSVFVYGLRDLLFCEQYKTFFLFFTVPLCLKNHYVYIHT